MTDDNGDSSSGKNLTGDELRQRREELEALYRRAKEIAREVGVANPETEAPPPRRVSKILCARHNMRTWRTYATTQKEKPGSRCRLADDSL